jgi:phage terminase large subunit-like protein
VPPHVDTYGPQVADLCKLAQFAPDPEQQLILDALFAVGEDDKAVALENAVIVGRQNLKTGVLKQATIGWLFLTDQRLVVWSAHEFRTAQEAFRDMEELIMGTPSFARRVKAIHRGNGDEAIELFGNRRLMFKARTKSGGRGLSGDKIILDEGFALQPTHMGSLFPTLAARPDPQVVYASSAGKVESGVLRASGTAAGPAARSSSPTSSGARRRRRRPARTARVHARPGRRGLRLRQHGAG